MRRYLHAALDFGDAVQYTYPGAHCYCHLLSVTEVIARRLGAVSSMQCWTWVMRYSIHIKARTASAIYGRRRKLSRSLVSDET